MLHKFRFKAMASENELQLYANDRTQAEALAAAATAEVSRIEEKYSRYRSSSVVSQINAGAGKVPVGVDQETVTLLDYAERCYALSDGLFDITSGVLRQIWNFSVPKVPSKKEIEEKLALIGWRSVERTSSSIFLPRPGMEIDFGGIGKEYAADAAAQRLMDGGVRHAMVNLAGDIRVIGPHADGSPWKIGITHPRLRGSVIASVAVSTGATTTSGDYERFFELDGRRYCHILNPRTGYPVSGLQSVTVCAPSCLVAGSICTIGMLMGPKRGAAFVADNAERFIVVKHDSSVISAPRDPMP